jgi:hypothetical protein
MPKSLSKTPAPKKDRIYGSDKNKVGSASSKASAKGIELSESILGTLSQKAKDYNESHPKNKVSVATLKAVMRRGMGAYSTSHRPTITGGAPNSRQAWGFARVNKFLKKKAGQQVKAAYVQDDDLMADGGDVKKFAFIEKWEGGFYWLITKDGDNNYYNVDGDKRLSVVKDMAKRWGYNLVSKKQYEKMLSDSKLADGGETKKPIIEQILEIVKPYQQNIVNKIVEKRAKEGEKLSKYALEVLNLSLIFDLYGAVGNYLEDTDKLVGDIIVEDIKGNIVIKAKVERGGEEYNFETDMILAGGHNIQRLHYRYIVKTKLKYHYDNKYANSVNEKIKKVKAQIKNQDKIEELKKDIKFYEETILKYKDIADKNKLLTDEQIWEILVEEKNSSVDFYNLTYEMLEERNAPILRIVKKEDYEAYRYENYYLYGINRWKRDNIEYYVKRISTYQSEIKKLNKKLDAYLKAADSMADGGSVGQEITCVNCGWHWNTSDSDESDKYICHKCGFDNRTFYDPEPIGEYHLGGDMSKHLAPNGKPSNLNHEQWHLVRTPEFKVWFGDWENDPENASKVVDENGEPKVVYHGSRYGGINIFDYNQSLRESSGLREYGNFFTDNTWVAELYRNSGKYTKEVDAQRIKEISKLENLLENVRNNREYDLINKEIDKWYSKTYEVFLNLRKVKEFDAEFGANVSGYQKLEVDAGYKIATGGDAISFLKEGRFGVEKVDGIIANNIVEMMQKTPDWKEYVGTSYLVFEPQNIKLADGSNTTFDASNPDIRYADGGATDFGKVVSASSRFRPMETIVFDPPLVGLNGAKLISYTWSFQWETSFSKLEGEAISKRTSDWTQAEISAETGRDIVHKYTIQMPNGDLKVVSSDSVPVLLGYTDRAQKSSFPNLSNAAKTLAKQKLQLSIIEAKAKEKADAIAEIVAKGIPEVRVEEGGLRGYKFIIGDSVCYGDDPNDKERLECPKDGYIRNRLKEMGIDAWRNYDTYDLKNRIERQERKIKDILNGKNTAEMGMELPSQHDLIKMELGLELFKPSKTIEQIAKEKDVPLDYAEEQLRKGMKTESEHSDNPIVQETIALQHLDEMIDYYDKLEYMESQNKMAKGDLLDNSLFNKALIYKSIKPIRQANEIIERLDYMEIQNKMEKGGVTEFYKEYQDWYKNGVSDKMTIMVSVPNAFSKMSSADNHVILDVFEKRNESVDGKEKLKELLELADKNGIDVYLEPIPRHNHIKDSSKKEKITREYLISYYEKFGFELLPNGFMVRKHKNNKMEKGGYYKAGGEINPDDKSVKDYFSHGSGNVGGVLVGKRHSEGGIKAVNKSTNQPLEMEGGEVVITRNAVSDDTKREFEGKMMTNREILSKINQSGGGVSFADGGDIPETIHTSGKEYKYGGKMMKDHEIVSSCGCKHSMADGGRVSSKKIGGGVYEYKGLYISRYDGTSQTIWNIYNDSDLTDEYSVGYLTKKDAMDSIDRSTDNSMAEGGMIKDANKLEIGDKIKISEGYQGTFIYEVLSGARQGVRPSEIVYQVKIIDSTEPNDYFHIGKVFYKMFTKRLGRFSKVNVLEKGGYMADGGETDYQTELKNHLFPKVEVEVEVEPEMELMPTHEHYITADDLGLSDGMPMLAVGTIVYSSGGNDQWEVVSFSDDGVNLVNIPKSPLQSKMEDKHLTFDELIKYFKDKAISIKNISTERELEPAIALVKNKLPQKSYAMGGFIDGDEDEDAKIMQSQFGKSNFK